MLKRMWINAPSALQSNHRLHGVNVLVDVNDRTFNCSVLVYYISGPVESGYVSRLTLADGWH